MSGKLQIVLSVCTVLFLCGTIGFIRKKGLDLYHSIVWFFGALLLLLIALFPQPVLWLTRVAGIETPSNFVFIVIITFLLITTLSLSAAVSRHHMRIKRMVQSMAILENRIESLEAQLARRQDGEREDQAG